MAQETGINITTSAQICCHAVVLKIGVRLLFYAKVNSNQSYVREGC